MTHVRPLATTITSYSMEPIEPDTTDMRLGWILVALGWLIVSGVFIALSHNYWTMEYVRLVWDDTVTHLTNWAPVTWNGKPL